MNSQEIKAKLTHAVTDYDRKESTKKSYNRYALGIYFQRVDDICADVEAGADLREAITRGFLGRLADRCLKECGLTKSTDKEARGNGAWHYIPASANLQQLSETPIDSRQSFLL